MSKQYQKLLTLLKELFQTNEADLDFGLYKVINQRRDEINRFLDEELLPQVKAAFSVYQSMDKKTLEVELTEAIKGAEELGVDPDTVPKVKRIREQVATYSVDVDDLENQVYSALFNFFRRYYDNGDFISQRRYKEGVYAIPYEGEEVKLYWANHDQYYIKTSEYLRDYTFKLPYGNKAHFKLVEAEIEKDNRKETDDKKRRFILAEEPLIFEDGEISILFEFRPDEEKRVQNKLNEQAVETIIGLREQSDDQAIKDSLAELVTLSPTESDKNRTLLAKHLEDYTRRNTQDYFIHKDLGKFLRREMDFFIKNEIMDLDNIENEDAPKVEQYLNKIKVIRQIAYKLIDFLAQIEDFQKKLWLKKKFVVETNYCVTLDRIPEELYAEIAANEAQREEWVRLFAINEIQANGDMFKASYSEPLTIEFLKQNPFLLVDTKFFDEDFKFQLISILVDYENEIDGILIQSENFQALQLLKNRYTQAIKTIYIDPPYNTDSTPILYKNGYRHSTWATLMFDRLFRSMDFLKEDGVEIVAIDDTELVSLSKILEQIAPDYRLTRTIVVHNPKGSITKDFNRVHEYALYLTKENKKNVIARTLEENEKPRRIRRWGAKSLRTERRQSFYPIYVLNGKITRIGNVPDDDFHPQGRNIILESGEIEIWPIDQDGIERRWNFGLDTIEDNLDRIIILEVDGTLDLFVTHELSVPKTVWIGGDYDAGNHGNTMLVNILGEKLFDFPKSIKLVERCINISTGDDDAIVLDFFAGSGTTAHATINLNRKDQKHRKYILVEMGSYFDTVMKPRVQRVIYSKDWENGKPVSRKGSSHAFKYIKLESYEDTLNNLELRRTNDQAQALLDKEAFKEDYLLHYMLDFESRGSLLDLQIFNNPFDYQLKIASSTVGETVFTKIDLVETFNYLVGLQVRTIRRIDGVVLVEGQTRDNRQVLVIWRNIDELDSEMLNSFFTENFTDRQKDYDVIYVNGDNTLQNIRPQGATWNVHLIEEEFLYRMFEER